MTGSSVAILAAVAGMLTAAITSTEALRVVAPSEGMMVVADRPYLIEWTGDAAEARFDVDLHYCGSYSFCLDHDEACGFFIASLCAEGDDGCVQEEGEGGYDVVMPEPIAGYSGDGYRVRIAEVGTDTYRCSDDFYLMASADAPQVGDPWGPSLAVIAPSEDSIAVAGGEYTVVFDYDNGFGERVGRFKIDLYEADGGEGDCGLWVTSICDKPEMGCRDTVGDYDITIPAETKSGMYRIRVGLFGDDALFACSDKFGVLPSTNVLLKGAADVGAVGVSTP